MPNELKNIEDKLEQVIALLKMVVSDKIVEKRHAILSTPKKQRIYEMCDIRSRDTSNGLSLVYIKTPILGPSKP